ncbi:MAG: VOC family protein [Ruminococcus sp.]|nr:VOC family protein [Ruminococcus sp.]
MEFQINSLYLCVKDMDRAINFYEELFEQKVTEKSDTYSVFDVNGFRLGLFAYEKKNEPHTFGSNCLPSISVDSLSSMQKKLKGKELCFPVTRIKDNFVAEFIDSEGNHIEITAPYKLNEIIGRTVTVTVDRPLGSAHPNHADMIYKVNYGYIEGLIAQDSEEQDAYILGVHEAVDTFTGRIIAVIRRSDDVEEKWVVCPENVTFSKDEIMKQVEFQEKYFKSEIIM